MEALIKNIGVASPEEISVLRKHLRRDAILAMAEKFESASHRAAAWIAKGDLAARRGDDSEAARLYRRAAETLQDFRF